MPAFINKFNLLDANTQLLIMEYAREHGAWEAAKKYAQTANMTLRGLDLNLKKKLLKEKPEETLKEGERILTKKEKDFLKALENGSVGLEEASRMVAVKVFEKMLKNPDNFHYVDFFRTELLKLKQQENTDRNNYASELMNRMFGGYLPPRACPKCGYEIIKISQVVKGEVISESLPASGSS